MARRDIPSLPPPLRPPPLSLFAGRDRPSRKLTAAARAQDFSITRNETTQLGARKHGCGMDRNAIIHENDPA